MLIIQKIITLDSLMQTLQRDRGDINTYYPVPTLMEKIKELINTELSEPNPEFGRFVRINCISLIDDFVEDPEAKNKSKDLNEYRDIIFYLLKSNASRAIKYFQYAIREYKPVFVGELLIDF